MAPKTVCCALLVALAGCPYAGRPEESYRLAHETYLKGNLPKAESEAEQGARQWPAQAGSDWHWKFLLLRARVMLLRGRSDPVPALLQGFPTDPVLNLESKVLIANSHMKGAHYKEALALFDEADKQSADPGLQRLRVEMEVLRGLIYIEMEKYQQAEDTLQVALSHSREIKDEFLEARAWNNLGLLRMEGLQQPDEAMPYYQKAAEHFDAVGALAFGELARDNLAICYGMIGEFEKAVAIRNRAIESFQKLDAQSALQQAIGEFGNLYLNQEDPANAITRFKQAFDLAQSIDEPRDAGIWAGNLASAYVEMQRWDEAEVYNLKAAAIAQSIKDPDSLQYTDVNAAAIDAGRGHLETSEALYRKLLSKPTLDPAVRWQAHAGLGALVASQKRWDEARAEFEKAIQVVQRERARIVSGDQRITFLARLIRVYQQYIEILLDKGDIERALYVADSSRAITLTEGLAPDRAATAGSTTPDYRKTAKKWGGVILSYWIAPKESYLWAITPDQVKLFPLGPDREIANQIDRYQASIEKQLSDPLESGSAAGHRLYDLLVRPAAELLHPGDRIFVIPDGRLHSLNMETLLTPGTPTHYWIDDATISIAPSLRMLAAGPPANAKGTSGLLLIGDPDSNDPDFPKLQYARSELTAIQKQFSAEQCSLYAGAQATPEVYRRAIAGKFSMIHFSAHAMANRQTPLDSAIILSNSGAQSKLYARNIMELPIRANLVTLSACRSAGARAYAGEGLVGFSWAFLRAGAHNVVAGLWDVGDRSTAEFMGEFYGFLGQGRPPAEALRATKLKFLHQANGYRKPYNWAPFQIYTSGGV